MADSDGEVDTAPGAGGVLGEALGLDETLELNGPDGPLPGIPLPVPNGKRRPRRPTPPPLPAEEPEYEGGPVAAAPRVCVPCLIARGVVLAAGLALLITMIVLERRKAAAAAKAEK